MSSSDGISPISAPPTVLTPERDRAALHPSELTRFYTIQELRMVTPIAYRDGATKTSESQAVPAARGSPRVADQLREARSADRREPAEAARPSPRLAPPRDAAHSTAMLQRNSAVRAEGPKTMEGAVGAPASLDPPSEPLPYGDDPARIRALVDEVADDHAFVPFTFHYRQAGDLVPTIPSEATKPYASVRQVNAIYKAV